MTRDVNLELVRARAAEARDAAERASRYASQEDAVFFADERNLYAVMHLLLIAIEACAGLCNHIVAKTTRTAPASYADCFETLRENGVIDEALAARLVRMARFRNVLGASVLERGPGTDRALRA